MSVTIIVRCKRCDRQALTGPKEVNVRSAPKAAELPRCREMQRWAINVRFASRRTAAKFASLFDEAGGGVRDMTEIDRTGEHA